MNDDPLIPGRSYYLKIGASEVSATLAQPKYKLMAMSIFASGAANIPQSIDYIKTLKLDYVVFGTSNLTNVKSNLDLLKNNSI